MRYGIIVEKTQKGVIIVMAGKVYIVNQEYKANYKVFFVDQQFKEKMLILLKVANLLIKSIKQI